MRRDDSTHEESFQFVVHEHQSRSHHFDFRLEIDDVLKSWAVPKGPSMNPKQRHLAIAVADHPLSYAAYEGVIPEGRYGAGPVIIWDRGTYKPLGNKDPLTQLSQGHLAIFLEGKKLHGVFFLRKMTGRKDQWLLSKFQDHYANANWEIKSELSEARIKQLEIKPPVCSGTPSHGAEV